MFDSIYLLFAVAVFIAVAFGLEGGFLWWNSKHGAEIKRLRRRLEAVSTSVAESVGASLQKRRVLSRSEQLHRLLSTLPLARSFDRLLHQSGLEMTVAEFIGMSLGAAFAALLVSAYFSLVWPIAICLIGLLAALPTLYVLRAKSKRLARIETQLPDAIDLMGRALRAGHAFPTALGMVAEEMPAPIAAEFRILFDEVNYGISLHDALLNLLSRVPSTDLQYLTVALLIQRETGGNLAELLDNISSIIRSRIKLMGDIRVLSAEGRLSAWILSLLPFGAALLINLVNPGFMAILWTDPAGLKLIYGALAAMAFGIWWMTRIIKIRV